MKRIIIVICLLGGMLGISLHASYTINAVRDGIEAHTQAILKASDKADKEEILDEINSLSNYWISVESNMIHYVRRNLVEIMSQSIARLYPLAEYEDWPAFHAELLAIRWQIEDILQSEALSLKNIF
jgi:hypothetical protein